MKYLTDQLLLICCVVSTQPGKQTLCSSFRLAATFFLACRLETQYMRDRYDTVRDSVGRDKRQF